VEIIMKITSLDPQLANPTPVGERRTPAAKTGGPVAEPSAKVEISAAAQAAAQQVDAGAFDAAKVEQMQQKIKDGTFAVNPDAIADKLIANAREQLAKTYR
jgi:negative regulator of flagellin synthesis FlgM